MKALALVLALTLTVAAVMAGGSYKGHSGGHGGGYGDDDVDVRTKMLEDFKGKIQDLNLCECDATNAFVSVYDAKIGEDAATATVPPSAYIEFKFILDNSLPIVDLGASPALTVESLGVALDLHGACDDCNDLIAIQTPLAEGTNGGVVIAPDEGPDCEQKLEEPADDQLKGSLRIYFRDGTGSVTTSGMTTIASAATPGLTLSQVLARTNGRFFAQIFLIRLGEDGVITRYACATVTGTITPKSCAGNKWGIGQNNICAATQCSRGPKQRLGRAVAQAKTFDCCDDTDVFGCCAADGKSDPSTCAALNTHHRCGPDAWKCDLSNTYAFAKQRSFLTSEVSDWSDFETNEFGRTSSAARNAANSNGRFSGDDDYSGSSSRRSEEGGGGGRGRRGGRDDD